MTDQEVEQFLSYWKERGVDLPSPIHQPKLFEWYVKLYKYYKK